MVTGAAHPAHQAMPPSPAASGTHDHSRRLKLGRVSHVRAADDLSIAIVEAKKASPGLRRASEVRLRIELARSGLNVPLFKRAMPVAQFSGGYTSTSRSLPSVGKAGWRAPLCVSPSLHLVDSLRYSGHLQLFATAAFNGVVIPRNEETRPYTAYVRGLSRVSIHARNDTYREKHTSSSVKHAGRHT
jgi:hypothetical protein